MGSLVHQVLDYVQGLGYWGIFLGLMLEVIPNELLLAYAGFLVSNGQITFLGALLCAVAGGTLAQIVLYWIGRYGGRPFLEKYGKYLLIHKHHIDVAESWFNKYGTGMIFTARFIPVVRHAISIPGGMARMPLSRFTLYTALALVPYSILYISLGMTLKDNWEKINEYAGPYIKPVILAAIILTALYIGYKFYMKKRSSPATAPSSEGAKRTVEQLRQIGREYRVLNFLKLQGAGGIQEYDHILVGPGGVFHIDSNDWTGEITFMKDGVARSDEGDSEDPAHKLHRHHFVLKELLKKKHPEADVVGILCFTHPGSRVTGASQDFTTVKLDQLLTVIKGYKTKNKLTPYQIRDIEKWIKEKSQSGA